jgi:hypothetical protein
VIKIGITGSGSEQKPHTKKDGSKSGGEKPIWFYNKPEIIQNKLKYFLSNANVPTCGIGTN